MLSFENLLLLKKRIYETAWRTFVYLIKNKIDPIPENYKKFFEKFFEEEATEGNPIKRIFDKSQRVLQRSSENLEQIATSLHKLEEKTVNIKRFLDEVVGKLEKESLSLRRLKEEIRKVEQELEAVSRDRYIDPLTGVWNRLALEEFLPLLPKIAMERNVVVAFIDLNHFKRINDTYGHLVGDAVLKFFATYTKENLKHKDFFARYGGDEFVAILFDIDLEKAKQFFQNLRNSIPPLRLETGEEIKIDFCVGLTVPFGNDRPEEIIHRADIAMYRCKETNKVEIKLK